MQAPSVGSPGGGAVSDDPVAVTAVSDDSSATGGYRPRVNGEPVAGLEGVLEDEVRQVRVPVEAVRAQRETVLAVEALHSLGRPKAVWQSLLGDPAGPPD